jgi:hypothetical protein
MIKPKSILILICLGLFTVSGIVGCTYSKRAAIILPEPTCSEAASKGIHRLSDNELVRLLDRSVSVNDESRNECWVPLMKAGLDANRDLPGHHLKKAIKDFNQRRYEIYFHKAIYRYYAGLINRPDRYDEDNKVLLESYCSYLINTAESSRDEHLVHAKLICRKLDGILYARLFQ